jgi:hypothetical protein
LIRHPAGVFTYSRRSNRERLRIARFVRVLTTCSILERVESRPALASETSSADPTFQPASGGSRSQNDGTHDRHDSCVANDDCWLRHAIGMADRDLSGSRAPIIHRRGAGPISPIWGDRRLQALDSRLQQKPKAQSREPTEYG